jgi:Na+-translocating ferredoxin:NAD+ oxidoreductase subunit B
MTANARAIDDLLPQTQCTRCGYQGCLPYAEAVVSGEAGINQCPPGGSATIERLAALTGREPLPLNPTNGVEAPPTVAFIDEERCIGCTKCLPPCPVDAIVGASRRMHTVIVDLCTGCELCVAPCPVDCIVMVPRASVPGASADLPPPTASRERYQAHTARVARRAAERAQKLAAKKLAARHPS